MIKVENIEVWGFEHAIRGARNPLNSWNRSDSGYCHGLSDFCDTCDIYPGDHNPCRFATQYIDEKYVIGPNDLDLMRRLYKAGTEHRKYTRQIFVSLDITAPLYWWKEADTYKIGTTANSCSTMHKIAAKPFTREDFSHEHLNSRSLNALDVVISNLNDCREEYLKTKDKEIWWQMIQLLPSSYNQKRTLTMNYENVFTMIRQRTGHKLDEWNEFVEILKELPYVKKIME